MMTTKTDGEILATYNLCLIGPEEAKGPAHSTTFTEKYLNEIEENINDLLPTDYRVEIREWNDETKERK
jgi:hypothetical protein